MNTPDPYADFRLNLEQQKKRAKELLRAAKAGDDAALRRITAHRTADDTSTPTLAAAQPPKTRHRDAYRLIVWLTAIGFLITSMAMVAFALDRTLF